LACRPGRKLRDSRQPPDCNLMSCLFLTCRAAFLGKLRLCTPLPCSGEGQYSPGVMPQRRPYESQANRPMAASVAKKMRYRMLRVFHRGPMYSSPTLQGYHSHALSKGRAAAFADDGMVAALHGAGHTHHCNELRFFLTSLSARSSAWR
jgi:hypothetical protein